ncbi:MAG: hypothetical protein E7041_08040 [Lentisphaerae bacterium]|nr:hypothetical protein [Lentisphaerota bacterium]MBQ9803628.1 hypothetical protein [Lentisphaeria bacterium]
MTQPQNPTPDEKLDALVEDALLRRATGYEDAAGKPVPPDVRAAMYWLENRRPDRWKRRRSPETDAAGITLSDEENAV